MNKIVRRKSAHLCRDKTKGTTNQPYLVQSIADEITLLAFHKEICQRNTEGNIGRRRSWAHKAGYQFLL